MATAVKIVVRDVRAALAVAFVVLVAPVRASTGPAQHGDPASTPLAGAWTLDPYVSDHPEQIARALRTETGEAAADGSPAGRAGERGGLGRGGFGRGDGGFGGSGRPRESLREAISDTDRKLLTELTDVVRFPPAALTITQAEAGITIGATGSTVTLQTNGKAEKQQLAAGSVDRTAAWDGPHLVVTYVVGRAGTLTYTYEVAPTTGQLVVRVNFERRQGDPARYEIKLVYNRG
jgi:hypothetical protein